MARGWSAWLVPAELQDRGMAILKAALGEVGVECHSYDWMGNKRFSCCPDPGPEVVLRAVNIAREATGLPTFDSVEDRREFDRWLRDYVSGVA